MGGEPFEGIRIRILEQGAAMNRLRRSFAVMSDTVWGLGLLIEDQRHRRLRCHGGAKRRPRPDVARTVLRRRLQQHAGVQRC